MRVVQTHSADEKTLTTSQVRALQLSFFYIGANAVIPDQTSVGVGPLTVGLVLSGIAAAIGWRGAASSAEMKRYMKWAIAVAGWGMISSLAAWRGPTAYSGLIFATWICFVIPGLAFLLREDRFRHVLLAGWAWGVSYYVVEAFSRWAGGRKILDEFARGEIRGENRNAVNIFTLIIVPYLFANDLGRVLKIVRWPFLGLCGFWLLYSGGRAGLLGLIVAVAVYTFAQPGMARKTRQVVGAALVGVFVVTAIAETGGQATDSADRLLSLVSGDRTPDDEARELLLRKAWHLASENPFFGVGFGSFEKTFHPVVRDTQSERAFEIASEAPDHNLYAGVLAELGFPGIVAFLILIGVLGVQAYRRINDRAARSAITMFAVLLVSVLFHSIFGPALYLPMALVLSSIIGPDPPSDPGSDP